MEQSFMPRSLWTNDSKFLHHHVTDFFSSVQVTQDIPAGTSFGPCVLHNTFYDTIAFIALKSLDKREKSFVFRVDPEAMKSSPFVVPWLRLVQAAMNTEEQNTEAYLKSGQLYFRTIRDVRQGEELLVWYDEELSRLLGFSDVKTRALSEDFLCGRCGQIFKNENPFLAHCRFLCAQVRTDIIRADSEQKQTEVKRQRKVTDFHNIARDLEHKKPGNAEDNLTTRKRKPEETLSPRSRKPVLLEKTNITNHTNITEMSKNDIYDQDLMGPSIKLSEDSMSVYEKTDKSGSDTAKSTEPQYEQTLLKDAVRQNQSGSSYQPDGEASVGLQSGSSAFSCVLPGRAHEPQRSAFCKPSKRFNTEGPQRPVPPLCSPQKPPEISETYNSKTVGYRNLLASHLFQCDPSTQTLMSGPSKGSYHFQHEHWTNGQLQANPSLSILPPTFSSLAVSVQNWCAKCNLSFRMTSDLVFHMRSHHKKEFATESQVRRRREEKLTCPICNEYFRERHHLSRHMTSHN
ncbi:zinc finger protein 488 [Brachyhypopomus gauderio]|uniref:zinc finger protein 488 n=1 Tax=Brachyhypopomus gauderio TaxID=698409 RepID=UPI0040419DA4